MADATDRRRGERVDAKLKLRVDLASAGTVADLETINISTSGVYFRSDHHIAPMTKLAMALELVVPGDDGGESRVAVLSCEGLVVRTQPEEPSPEATSYEIAVFFTGVDAEGKRILEDHIGYLLADA
jgi:hypothetical protein